MKAKHFLVIASLFVLMLLSVDVMAQCSICSRTVAQLGDKPARGLNAGILYLAAMPLAIVGFIGFRWWKNNKDEATHDIH